ncbi:MAG TPA: diguanylate cyclase [Thermoanaerobaculia bacterium]|nr:diguanylate cyclase [Thermoanaerobaculia bacterium]
MSILSIGSIIATFVRESDERLAEAEQFLGKLDRNPADADSLREVMRRFHGFAGVGGIDGFELINSAGQRGEAECRKQLKASESVEPDQIRRWRSLFAFIEAEACAMHRAAFTLTLVEPEEEQETEEGRTMRKVYNVLLVEDDVEIHACLGRRLSEEGFNVRSAFTRDEALTSMAIALPHAMIIGDASGYDLVSKLREERENAPVFIVSGREEFCDKVEAIRCGADAWFGKPLNVDAVIRKLRSLVESRDDTVARVLSVEDDVAQSQYLKSVLESAGYEVRSCLDPSSFEHDLATFAPNLILMDILLPGVSGYELARFVRQLDEHHATPILFLTSEREMHTRIEAMRSGGDDHIEKPVAPNLLLAAVEARVQRARQIRHFLDRDSLTGLLNRGAFQRRVETALRYANGALILLDVDYFKRLNDTYGHAFGDQVLARLASFLHVHVRVSDAISRYGGEEFAMFIEDVTDDEAMRLAERLRDEFASLGHTAPDGSTIYCSFSAGVNGSIRRSGSYHAAMLSADEALYRAKAEGRNRVGRAYEPAPRAVA